MNFDDGLWAPLALDYEEASIDFAELPSLLPSILFSIFLVPSGWK